MIEPLAFPPERKIEHEKLGKMFQEQDAIFSMIIANTGYLYGMASNAINGSWSKKDFLKARRLFKKNTQLHDRLLMLDIKLEHILNTPYAKM